MNASKKTPPVFQLRLPRSTRAQVGTLAHSQGVSINQFISEAVREKILHVEQVIADHEKPQRTVDSDYGSAASG